MLLKDSKPPISIKANQWLKFWAYVCLVLTLIPVLGIAFGLASFVLGVFLLRREETTHGLVNMIGSFWLMFVVFVMTAFLVGFFAPIFRHMEKAPTPPAEELQERSYDGKGVEST